MKIFAIILFILMYVVMIVKSKFRTWAALSVALIFVIAGIVPLKELFGAIDFNVLMMIAGTMVVVNYFIDSKMPGLIAESLLGFSKNVRMVIILMSLFAGIVSAFIDNVATVLMIAPVGLAICKKLNINPTGMLLSIAVSSNLQGAATLVGDTTSIMLGAYANMDFLSFFFMNGKLGIFWAVEFGALATVLVMLILFRKEPAPVSAERKTKVTHYFPTFALVGIVVLLIGASFIPNKPAILNGVICCAVALLCLIVDLIGNKKENGVIESVKGIDFPTIVLLAGMFIVIAGIKNVGLIDDAANLIGGLGQNNIFLLYTIIVWISVFFSAFVDNIPYVATMLPVVQGIAMMMGRDPRVLYFGLLVGATLGGNLTPIGASANIAAIGILQKEGYTVRFRDFAKIGIPFTLTAVTVGYLVIWFVWH